MKKKRLYFILLLVFLISAVPAAAADEESGRSAPLVSDEMVDILQANLYNIFVLRGVEINFNSKGTTKISDVGSSAAARYGEDGQTQQIQMFANADFIHDRRFQMTVSTGNLKNFLLSLDITVQEAYPADQGGCFIGYTNDTGSPAAADEGLVTKAILVDGSNQIGIYTRKEGDEAGSFTPLAQLEEKSNKVILARLMGQTFIFVNNKYVGQWDEAMKGEYDHEEDTFIGQFTDGVQGPFQFNYGAAIFSGGDTVSCSFDNLILRKATN